MDLLTFALQVGPCWGGQGGGMGPGWGMGGMGGLGGGLWGLGWLWSLLWLVVIVGVVAAAAYLLVTRTDGLRGGDGAMETLRARYASGEIDDEEFERRKAALSAS